MNVMIVEDDKSIRETLCQLIYEEGFGVIPAANGQEALQRLQGESGRPGLILLDMMMPTMDGWAFRAEQEKLPDLASIPVVVITAHANARDVATSIRAAGYLRKPLDLDSLLDVLERFRKDDPAPEQTP